MSWVASGTLGLTKPWRIQRQQQRLISQNDRYIAGKGICQGHSEHLKQAWVGHPKVAIYYRLTMAVLRDFNAEHSHFYQTSTADIFSCPNVTAL